MIFNWIKASKEQFDLVEKFKNIFIKQEKNKVDEVFHKDFGLHNGFTVQGYCDYEFDEFFLKCDKFALTTDAQVECFDIGNNYIYFSLGKKDDKAVFEAIFLWDNETQKIKGNQYNYKIEPKIQFYKNYKTNVEDFNRRINIKAPDTQSNIKKVIISESSHDLNLVKQELDDIFGGNFYSLIYQNDDFSQNTHWNEVTIFANNAITKNLVLMRGKDHPLFIENLYPQIISEYEFNIDKDIYPVVINVEFEDGTEEYFKYPLNKNFKFHKKFKKVCLTDTLSFDWIISNIL